MQPISRERDMHKKSTKKNTQKNTDTTFQMGERPCYNKIFFPFQAGVSFSRFIIKHRNTDNIEDVKRVLCSLEKDTLLLALIPIAFDGDLDIQVQLNGLFTNKFSN